MIKPFSHFMKVKSRNTEQGFALPLAIAMGLIALLIGLIAAMRAQDDRVTSINTQETVKSQLATEAGIVQIQNMLNRYRMLANFDACNDDDEDGEGDWGSDGKCTNAGTSTANASWGNPGIIPNLNAVCGTGTLAESRTEVNDWTTNDWQQVDEDDESKGEYRLVDYTNGVLTVEGIVKRDTTGESRTMVQVTLPTFSMENEQMAGLWVTNASTPISGNPSIASDVVVPCAPSAGQTLSVNSDNIIKTQLTRPAAPSAPTDDDNASTDTDNDSDGVYTLTNISNLSGTNSETTLGKKLPRSTDVSDADGEFNYLVGTLDDSFETLPGYAVNIWVTGTGAIDLQNKLIVNPCGSTNGCGPFDVRIYGNGALGTSLTLNQGTAICDVFFHLPNYSATFNSGGSTTKDCGGGEKNTGVFWLYSWSGNGGGDAIISPRVSWQDALNVVYNNSGSFSDQSLQIPPPRIGPPERWEPDSDS
jgi:hypothetical protein